ncbi:unnamed protein product [Schistocephalus solidus]|uniref:Craniofacial development protein 2 n=1 Tax=Schistocephalus solidus TaxID=70667 RepID=A0A183SVA7_SCHSO|nr:unnamed protein product [Schistocephalus solidus]
MSGGEEEEEPEEEEEEAAAEEEEEEEEVVVEEDKVAENQEYLKTGLIAQTVQYTTWCGDRPVTTSELCTSCLVTIRRKDGHFTNISIVSVYTPNPVAEQRDKETFYSQLQAFVERLPCRNLLVAAGEWNGRTGCGDFINGHIIGRFELFSRCEGGERLLNFADQNRLSCKRATNTCYPSIQTTVIQLVRSTTS